MSKKTIAVFVLCWSVLATTAWKLCEHAIFEWVLHSLEHRIELDVAMVLATITAAAVPLAVSGAVILFVYFWTRHITQQQILSQSSAGSVAPANAEGGSHAAGSTPVARRDAKKNIAIKPSQKLLNMSVRFGLLHVRDGKDEVVGHVPPLNEEIWFQNLDDRGTLVAAITYDRPLGFQFKCFVDHGGLDYRKVKQALEESGFAQVSAGKGKAFRAWFILPEYDTCKTVDKFTNNFVYPA
jgi:hypothetical protein